MTVAAQTPSIEYIEDGVTLDFAVPWRYRDPEHLRAERQLADGSVVELVYGIEFSASAGDSDAGGTLTVADPAANGTKLVIWRVTPRTQTTDYITTGAFSADSHEAALDEGAMRDQEADRELGRAIKVRRGQDAAIFNLADALPGYTLILGEDGEWAPQPSSDGAAAIAQAAAVEAAGYALNLATAQRFSYAISSFGQSLAKGRAPLVTDAPHSKLLIFNGGEEYDFFDTYSGNDAHMQNVGANMGTLVSFTPDGDREGWGQGLAYVLGQDQLCDDIAFFCAADGARHARELLYNGGRFANFANGVQRQAQLLDGYIKPIVIWTQGEADADTTAPGGGSSENRVSQAQHFNILKDMRDQMRRVVGPSIGRSVANEPLYVMPLNPQGFGDGSLNIQASYIDAINDGGFVILPPHYQFWEAMEFDGVHMGGQGRRYMAELAGQIIDRINRQGLPYQPVHVVSAAIVGATIELTFATPDGSDLVIDTTTFADPAITGDELYGVRFYNTSGSAYASVSSISASGKKLIVTPAVAPAAGDRIEIAQQPWPGGTGGGLYAPSNTPRSNIRCGLSHEAEDGTPLYHYALPQRVTL